MEKEINKSSKKYLEQISKRLTTEKKTSKPIKDFDEHFLILIARFKYNIAICNYFEANNIAAELAQCYDLTSEKSCYYVEIIRKEIEYAIKKKNF